MWRVIGREKAAPATMVISAKGAPMIAQKIRRRLLQESLAVCECPAWLAVLL